jgi:hypothetical protein
MGERETELARTAPRVVSEEPGVGSPPRSTWPQEKTSRSTLVGLATTAPLETPAAPTGLEVSRGSQALTVALRATAEGIALRIPEAVVALGVAVVAHLTCRNEEPGSSSPVAVAAAVAAVEEPKVAASAAEEAPVVASLAVITPPAVGSLEVGGVLPAVVAGPAASAAVELGRLTLPLGRPAAHLLLLAPARVAAKQITHLGPPAAQKALG